jgi:hypothetical protein
MDDFDDLDDIIDILNKNFDIKPPIPPKPVKGAIGGPSMPLEQVQEN